MRTPIVGGNWKMNTTGATGLALASAVADAVDGEKLGARCGVAIFPPFPYLREIGEMLRGRSSTVMLGAQDVYFERDGAFTGEISVNMLKDCGVSIILAGHSERRHVLDESDEIVNKKARAALEGGFTCLLCVGETLAEREQGQTDGVNRTQTVRGLEGIIAEQMARVVIAYEPVWAIGTGRTATPADAQDAQRKIRGVLAELYGGTIADATRIQYGGSVKGSNAAELFGQPDLDGGLIGGASLKADEFLTIVRAAAASCK